MMIMTQKWTGMCISALLMRIYPLTMGISMFELTLKGLYFTVPILSYPFKPRTNEWMRACVTWLDIDLFSYCQCKSNAPLQVLLFCLFLLDGIAASMTISLINYVLLGFQYNVDGFFMHSFEVFLATTVVFLGSGTLGYALLEYRLGHKNSYVWCGWTLME
jgi:hypothetical protein